MSLMSPIRVPLTPDHSKRPPKPRYGLLVDSPWPMPRDVLVRLEDTGELRWVPRSFLEAKEA